MSWPVGAGAKGSDGVAGTVQQIPGGIGYDESAYAEQNHLTTALLQNKAGKFVAPTMAAFQAAAASADWSKVQNFAIDLNDQPGAASWPIESATFVLLPTDPKDAEPERRGEEVLRLGLRARQRHRQAAALHPAAGQRARRDPRGLAEGRAGHHVTRLRAMRST